MTHAQFVYCNTSVHLKVKEGQTATAHETIIETMEGFLHTDPEQLLEEHRHLLFSDFGALAAGPTKDKLEWLLEMDSALGAASHVAPGSRHTVDMVLPRQPSLEADRVQVSPHRPRMEYAMVQMPQTGLITSVCPR